EGKAEHGGQGGRRPTARHRSRPCAQSPVRDPLGSRRRDRRRAEGRGVVRLATGISPQRRRGKERHRVTEDTPQSQRERATESQRTQRSFFGSPVGSSVIAVSLWRTFLCGLRASVVRSLSPQCPRG